MESDNLSIQLKELDYVLAIINNMRNEYALKINEERTKYIREREEEPIFCGYITTYQKIDGTTFKKRTKNMPYDYSNHNFLKEGYINQYGHKVLSIEKDYQLNLGFEDIDMNKKWYV
jgi:hypothetical protein